MRAHTAKTTRDYLQHTNIAVIDWPALSADLNPIEHLRDHIQLKLNQQQPGPTTAAELCMAYQSVWATIPMASINRPIDFIYRRCMAVINANGGYTRY